MEEEGNLTQIVSNIGLNLNGNTSSCIVLFQLQDCATLAQKHMCTAHVGDISLFRVLPSFSCTAATAQGVCLYNIVKCSHAVL